MADLNCSACEEIRKTDPNLIVNGFGDDECYSLQNNTGLVTSSGHSNFEDLNNLNDCLVGNMAAEVDSYDVCDWKEFMKNFISNVWTTLKAIICAFSGLWTKVDCVYQGLVALGEGIGQSVGGQSFVRYFRDNSGQTGSQYYWDAVDNASHTLDIYMDADVDDPGSQEADKDYVVLIANCTDMQNPVRLVLDVTYYSSGETDTLENLRLRRAQHPTYIGDQISELSWTTSGAVLVKKGEHIKVNGYVIGASGSSNPKFRLHQFVLTWIPVNVSGSFDPGELIQC